MFKKLKAKLEKMTQMHRQSITAEISKFNDPIAEKTEWSPLKRGGSNFKTHNLEEVSSSLLKYKLSVGGILFIGLFGLIGSIVAVVGLFLLITGSTTGIFIALFGGVFAGVAYIMYRKMGAPILFDATMGYIWIGRKPPKFSGDNKISNKLIYFNDIHAIQILSERVSSQKSSYYSYELNMILKDGSRFAIVDHGNQAQIIIDAETLSSFLGKPVWDISC